MSDETDASEAGKALGKLGASKGGRARAASLSPEQRSEIARKAVETRWAKKAGEIPADLPFAEYQGTLQIGPLSISCCVLADGTRLLSEREFTKSLGGKRGGSHWQRRKKGQVGADLPVFLSANNLSPYIPQDLAAALRKPILYSRGSGSAAYGIEANVIPKICNVFLAARDAGALHPSQVDIAHQADVMMRGLAEVGIAALVDEATGYQDARPRDDLHRILEMYIAKELLPWTKRFPDEFYEQLFRLKGWDYPPKSSKRPKIIGKLTEQLVYKRLPPGVLEEIKAKNPVVYKGGSRKARHHQLLTDEIGNPHLEKQVLAVTTILRISQDWHEFLKLFERSSPNAPHQTRLALKLDEEGEG